MPTPEDFNPENSRICWPAILAVFAVQMLLPDGRPVLERISALVGIEHQRAAP